MTFARLNPFEYQLLDFGGGRKLEQFGSVVLDRYSPAAEGFSPASPQLWKQAVSQYVRRTETEGDWINADALPQTWDVGAGPLRFRLKPTRFGHLGLFPEQFANWQWLHEACEQADRPLKLLNLFGYTGGSTLASALAGAEVTHVDAAGNVVKWARQNAEQSGLAEAPIRWIAEDVRKFVKREIKRGTQYDGVILDPPSYGHGSKGEVWRIGRHLQPLLEMVAQIVPQPELLLMTCHSPGFEEKQLRGLWREAFPQLRANKLEAGALTISDAMGRQLPAGYFASYRARD